MQTQFRTTKISPIFRYKDLKNHHYSPNSKPKPDQLNLEEQLQEQEGISIEIEDGKGSSLSTTAENLVQLLLFFFGRRKLSFFAHTPDQLRLLPPSSTSSLGGFMTESYDCSQSRLGIDSFLGKPSFGSSPTSTLYSPPSSPPTTESPPMSPCGSLGFNSVSELAGSMRSLQIGKASRMSMSPPSWGVQMGSGFGSLRTSSTLRPGFISLPATPTRNLTRSGLGVFELWDQSCEEEPVMERVESGRDLRAKIYAKLSKENSLARVDSSGSGPDVGWVSELVK